MARSKHSKKEVEAAITYAEGHGWTVEQRGGGHAWGILRCPHNDEKCRCGEFCSSSIWSTPRNPGSFARKVRKWVDNCIHDGENGEP
jgi:hypothetical protein